MSKVNFVTDLDTTELIMKMYYLLVKSCTTGRPTIRVLKVNSHKLATSEPISKIQKSNRKPKKENFSVPNSFPLALAVLLFRFIVLYLVPKWELKSVKNLRLPKNFETYSLGATFHAEFENDLSFSVVINFTVE